MVFVSYNPEQKRWLGLICTYIWALLEHVHGLVLEMHVRMCVQYAALGSLCTHSK